MNVRKPSIHAARVASIFAIYRLICCVDAHGYMETPRQRGILESNPFTYPPPIVTGLAAENYDYKCHFPAGNKADWPGAGVESQKIEGASTGWTPYEPWNPAFVFRSGVCGDPKWNLEHQRGGRFYYPRNRPQIVANYEQGGIIDFTITVVIWHMGYFEFTLCDVSKCGDEISEACLRDTRICRRLVREPVPQCESRYAYNCAPIDPNYPTRWYAPCPYPSYDSVMTWGDNGQIRYKLPPDMHCEHCVLQWYWVSATECNPPGVAEYFHGPRGPQWSHCPNFGDRYNGFGDWEQCGRHFPEEYYQCADVKVNPAIRSLRVYSNQELLTQVGFSRQEWIAVGNRPIRLELDVGPNQFKHVIFRIAGRQDWKSSTRPYVYQGTNWVNPIMDQWFLVEIFAEGYDSSQFNFYARLYFVSG